MRVRKLYGRLGMWGKRGEDIYIQLGRLPGNLFGKLNRICSVFLPSLQNFEKSGEVRGGGEEATGGSDDRAKRRPREENRTKSEKLVLFPNDSL